VKYGAHIFLWAGRYDTAGVVAVLGRAVGLGLDFVEIACGDDVRLDAEAVANEAASRGLELVLSPGGQWPLDCDISLADPAQRRRGLDWHRRAIDFAAACRAVAYTGAIYGHPGRVSPAGPTAAELERVAAGLRELAGHAAGGGLRLVIEPMSHFRTHLVNTPNQALDLVGRCGHPNLGVLLDTYHLCTEITDFTAAIEAVLPHLWGMHACENNRGVPGTGILPWAAMLRPLARARWDGYVGFESYNSSLDSGAFARSRGMFHDVCPDGDDFVRRGKAFLEQGLRLPAGPAARGVPRRRGCGPGEAAANILRR
jgi:D-psicose/D-tagatose/L-ribulose 3-epimerase